MAPNADLSMPSSGSVELPSDESPALGPNISLRDFPSASIGSLTQEEENEIVLRIRLDDDREAFTPVNFSDARPKDDTSSPVTMESLFDLVTRILEPEKGRIKHLEVTFWERGYWNLTPYEKPRNRDMQPLMITRDSGCSWEVFMFYLRQYVDEHKDMAWHIAIGAFCL